MANKQHKHSYGSREEILTIEGNICKTHESLEKFHSIM